MLFLLSLYVMSFGGIMHRTSHSQDALRESIRLHSQNLRILHSELARSANVSRPLITSFVAGRLNLSTDTAERVRKALLELIRVRASAVGFLPLSSLPINCGDLQVDARNAPEPSANRPIDEHFRPTGRHV
jgi:hypothetical protein